MLIEPVLFNQHVDVVVAHSRHSAMAKAAWDSLYCNGASGQSPDFELGFKEGFADFLDFGGSGEPPAIPPRRYWKNRYQTPLGSQAVQDWFAGFRQGTAEAQASGCREYATVPTPLSSDGAPPLTSAEPVPTPAPLPMNPSDRLAPGNNDPLPAPQALPD